MVVLQSRPEIPFISLGLEDGSNFGGTRNLDTGVLYSQIKDAGNYLGKGTDFVVYGIDITTGAIILPFCSGEKSCPGHFDGQAASIVA